MNARALPALLLLPALLATAGFASRRLEASQMVLGEEAEVSVFPACAAARPLAFGRTRLVADLAWLEAIQYYGRHRKTDREYPYARALFRTLADLDPQFEPGYTFGAIILSEEARQPREARELLLAGIERNPQSWRLCFELGFLAYLQDKGSPEAVEHLRRASTLPGAPESVGRLAAWAARASGQAELALELWREVLRRSTNEEVRRIARRHLRELGAPEAMDFPQEDGGKPSDVPLDSRKMQRDIPREDAEPAFGERGS